MATSSESGKRRSLSAGGVIARSPRRSGGGVFSLSIVFHNSTRFLALPTIYKICMYIYIYFFLKFYYILCCSISASRTIWASGISRSGEIGFVFHCSTSCFV